MAGRREKRKKRRVWKGVWLALCLAAGLTVMTPLTPTLDVPLTSVAAAASPVGSDSDARADFETESSGARGPEDAAEGGEIPEASPGKEPAAEPDSEAKTQDLPVEDGYFSDAAFIGDSRTEGLHLYSGLKEGAWFYAVGATVQTVMEKATQDGPEGTETVLDALSRGSYGKIYIMLGVNELGWYRTEEFTERYAEVIGRIRDDHPEAVVVIQSLPPVSAKQDAKHSYVNNSRIVLFNRLLEELAEKEGCVFLDVASAVTDENGMLPAELTADGVHLGAAGCKKWLQYLRENPV